MSLRDFYRVLDGLGALQAPGPGEDDGAAGGGRPPKLSDDLLSRFRAGDVKDGDG